MLGVLWSGGLAQCSPGEPPPKTMRVCRVFSWTGASIRAVVFGPCEHVGSHTHRRPCPSPSSGWSHRGGEVDTGESARTHGPVSGTSQPNRFCGRSAIVPADLRLRTIGVDHGVSRHYEHPRTGWNISGSRPRDPHPRGHTLARTSGAGVTCCACGARHCNQANGARSACSPPTMAPSSRRFSPRCRCGCGAPMRSRRSRHTRMTRPGKPRSSDHPRQKPATGSSWPRSPSRSRRAHQMKPSMRPAREADRARELASKGHLLRLWTLPGEGHALGLWQAHDAAGMEAILTSLPLYAWMSVQTTPLTPHPSDPGRTSS
jgi:muconolactone delta-isomerase